MQPLVKCSWRGNTAVLSPPKRPAHLGLSPSWRSPSSIQLPWRWWKGDGDTCPAAAESNFEPHLSPARWSVVLVMAAAARISPGARWNWWQEPGGGAHDAIWRDRRRNRPGKAFNAGQPARPDHSVGEKACGPPLNQRPLEAEFLRAYGPDPLRFADLARTSTGPVLRAALGLLGGPGNGGQIWPAAERSVEPCASPPPCWPSDQPTTR